MSNHDSVALFKGLFGGMTHKNIYVFKDMMTMIEEIMLAIIKLAVILIVIKHIRK